MSAPARYRWRLEEYSAVELIAVGLFAVAGSILGLAFAVVYIGMAAFSALGVEWHWVWETWI